VSDNTTDAHLEDLERKLSMLLRLLNHKGILKEADIIAVEA
jgi:hypothetical protein